MIHTCGNIGVVFLFFFFFTCCNMNIHLQFVYIFRLWNLEQQSSPFKGIFGLLIVTQGPKLEDRFLKLEGVFSWIVRSSLFWGNVKFPHGIEWVLSNGRVIHDNVSRIVINLRAEAWSTAVEVGEMPFEIYVLELFSKEFDCKLPKFDPTLLFQKSKGGDNKLQVDMYVWQKEGRVSKLLCGERANEIYMRLFKRPNERSSKVWMYWDHLIDTRLHPRMQLCHQPSTHPSIWFTQLDPKKQKQKQAKKNTNTQLYMIVLIELVHIYGNLLGFKTKETWQIEQLYWLRTFTFWTHSRVYIEVKIHV